MKQVHTILTCILECKELMLETHCYSQIMTEFRDRLTFMRMKLCSCAHLTIEKDTNCMCWSSGGRGGDRRSGPLPLKNHKNIGFLSNTCSVFWKSQSYQARIQCWVIMGPPAKHHLNGVSLAGSWCPAYSGIWILSPLIDLQEKYNMLYNMP